jgi:hypothetical protein
MSWMKMPTGLGAEPKKVAILAALLATGGVVYVYGPSDAPPTPTATRTTATQPALTPANLPAPRSATRPKGRPKGRGNVDEYKMTIVLPEDMDLTKVDPTIRQDLLARVRSVGDVGGSRSLFEFYTPPPPPVPPVKPGPVVVPPPPPPPPPPPGPPPVRRTPIPFKYFGFEGRGQKGLKRAFFVNAEETWLRGAGETISNRYKVVRIGETSAEVEDTVEKYTETLRLVDRAEPL